jgi:hypothetical protein
VKVSDNGVHCKEILIFVVWSETVYNVDQITIVIVMETSE